MTDDNEPVDLSINTEDRPELDTKLAELDILRQSLDTAKLKEKELFERLLRLSAEYDNFRKRTENRVQEARRSGREDILLPLITLADALIQAENATKRATDMESVKKGLVLVHQQFDKFFRDQGLVPIKAVGEKLDPHRHEAVAQEEREDVEDGLILEEIQRGYTWSDRLVRPARVKVSVKPNKDGKKIQDPANHNPDSSGSEHAAGRPASHNPNSPGSEHAAGAEENHG